MCMYKAHLENGRYHNVDIRLSGKSSDLTGLKRETIDNVWQMWHVAKEFGFYTGVKVRDENQPLNYIEGDKNKTNEEKPFSKKVFLVNTTVASSPATHNVLHLSTDLCSYFYLSQWPLPSHFNKVHTTDFPFSIFIHLPIHPYLQRTRFLRKHLRHYLIAFTFYAFFTEDFIILILFTNINLHVP